jgi:hypothetical protein
MLIALVLGLFLLLPSPAAAQNCACRDVNNDGVCDGADLPVLDQQWLGGVAFSDPLNTFLVPAGCSYTLAAPPTGGVRVTAKRIVFGGQLTIGQSGGAGILFDAAQDIVFLPGSQITSGGVVAISTSLLANAAVARASVGLRAGTTCSFLGTSLTGNPVTGFGAVGIQCGSDVQIHGSQIVAAGVNIQSMQGRIDGGPHSSGPTISLLACDDPALNANGNDNGVFDAGDLPCTVNFPGPLAKGLQAINAFCSPPNLISTLNNPLVLIAKGDVDLGLPGPGNVLEGRYKLSIISEDGDVDVSRATLANALPGATAPGGAKIVITADPFKVTRFPLFRDTVDGAVPG